MRKLLLLVLLLAAAIAAGCGEDDDEPEATPTTTAAAAADECAKDELDLVNPGKLTIGTDNPAFPPWFDGGTPKGSKWELNDPATGKGFESAVAYAVAEELGFAKAEVQWTVVPFNQSFRPGSKSFDFDINQISYTPQRAKSVDFSDSYYDVNQALVGIKGASIAKSTSLADLKQYKLGAQIGTTSYDYIVENIDPGKKPSVYDSNADAISALKAKQIDGAAVDFPTALFMAAVQLEGGKVVGRLPAMEGGEYFGVVLEKDSPLTECVNEAIGALHDDGTIERLEQKWLGGSAPVLG